MVMRELPTAALVRWEIVSGMLRRLKFYEWLDDSRAVKTRHLAFWSCALFF
jgi:hypothetical protein